MTEGTFYRLSFDYDLGSDIEIVGDHWVSDEELAHDRGEQSELFDVTAAMDLRWEEPHLENPTFNAFGFQPACVPAVLEPYSDLIENLVVCYPVTISGEAMVIVVPKFEFDVIDLDRSIHSVSESGVLYHFRKIVKYI